MRCWWNAVLLLPLLAGGCVTHKLWTDSQLDAWNEPADDPNLRLFRDGRRNDLLVVYDEHSERHNKTRARAFFLFQNQKLLQQANHPHFVNVNSSCGLTSVPVFFSTPTNFPEQFCEVTKTNGQNFTVFSAGQWTVSYQLPVYDDGLGKYERAAWTPLAVTADLTIVGGVLAIWCWRDLGTSGYSISVH
ncbi:MAG TPA: hypothetical protein VIK53_05645 [Verrucomicrobiae bacterium]